MSTIRGFFLKIFASVLSHNGLAKNYMCITIMYFQLEFIFVDFSTLGTLGGYCIMDL